MLTYYYLNLLFFSFTVKGLVAQAQPQCTAA